MKKIWHIQLSLVCVLLLLQSGNVQAVVISAVPVGNAGNGADDTGFGAVSYEYQVGTYEVTVEQYAEFLNAVAATDTYGLYNGGMFSGVTGAEIQQNGSPGSYTYSIPDANFASRPINFVSWGDAARFANWMHNGQPTGAQGLSTTEDGSYFLNGANTDGTLIAVTRTANATWVIPSENEWYKAAYHQNDGVTNNYWDYPTQSNAVPGRDLADVSGNNANYYGNGIPYPIDGIYRTTVVGEFQLSDSAYGTFDQGGNVYEWNEAVVTATTRGVRGIGWGSGDGSNMSSGVSFDDLPTTERSDFGIRLANVIPEPSTMILLATSVVGLLVYGGRKRKSR